MFKITTAVFLIFIVSWSCKIGKKKKPIGYYVEVNDSVQVRQWLGKGGNPNESSNGESLLYIATGPHGGNEVMRLLVKGGADINKGAWKYTPLMNAASWVNYEAVAFLLENGADPGLTNEKGQTALEVIGFCNCEEMIKTREILTKVTKANK